MFSTRRRSILVFGGIIGICGAIAVGIGIVCSTGDFEGPAVQQTWRSSGIDFADTDSLAACRMPDGGVRLLATAKHGHRVDCFDAVTGKFIRSYGREGTGDAEFLRPNGIAVCCFPNTGGDKTGTRPAAIVVERDGVRLHAFWADTCEFAGDFSDDLLRRPYGVAIHQTAESNLLFVTDARGAFDRRVHVFELSLKKGRIAGRRVRSFGEKDGDGVLVTPESLAIDPAFGHVLLCDEDETQMNVKVYTLDGTFTGKTFGREQIVREPEGIAVCGSGDDGFIILTDQRKDATVWHLYERGSYAFVASFTGSPNVANTDGIAVLHNAAGAFTQGALFAVNDDRDIRAYPLDKVFSLARDARQTPCAVACGNSGT